MSTRQVVQRPRPPQTAAWGTPAARLISSKKHNRLPVVEHGRLVGVVTRLDVLDALAHET